MSGQGDLPSPFEEYSNSRDAIIAAALDCVVTIDADGCVVEFNPAAERTFGYTREEMLGRELAELILPPEHREAHRAGMARFRVERTSRIIGRRLHLEAIRRSGERFPIELTVTAYKNPEGEPEYTAYLRDRTESEQERARREEAAEQLRQVTENTEGVVALVDWPSARLLHMSGQYGRTFQLPEDIFARDPLAWQALVAAEHRAFLTPLVERDPELEPIDVEVRRAGRESWLRVRAHPVKGADGAVTRLVVQTESITARKAVESQLERTSFVLEKVSDAIFLMGRDARFVYANEAATRLLGWSREELIGMTVFQIDAVMKPEVWPEHWSELESAGSMTLESVHRRRDGTEFPVEVSVNYALFDGQGLNCAVVRDISERKEAEAAVHSALEEARAAHQERESAFSNLGHELRTPLAAAVGQVDLIGENPADAESVVEWARRAKASCAQLGRMIDAVLAGSVPAAGMAYGELRPVEILEAVEAALAPLRKEAQRRGLRFEVKATGSRPSRVLIDPGWLSGLLDRVVSNALKYTQEGGVEIRVSATPSSLGAKLHLDVSDTGVGMDEGRIEEAFQRFVRLGPSAAGVDEGLGLGLALARSAVEASGGSLSIESAPGAGTLATVELDLELAEDSAWVRGAAAAAAEARPATSGLVGRVLVVEDSPELAQLYARWLADWGLDAEIEGDGRTAFERLIDEVFDLAIVDWRLPGMDGIELTRELRARGSFLPIVAVTAQDVPGARERCLEAGCSAFFTKPVDRDELHGLLHDYLEGGEALPAEAPVTAGGDPWLDDLRARFAASVEDDLGAIAGALRADDRPEVRRLAHRLKGGAKTFGFSPLADAAQELEALPHDAGSFGERANELLDRLRRAHADLA